MNRKKHIHHMNHTIQELKTELFGDMDIFDWGNILMVCMVSTTFVSLALYAFCVYCI